MSTSRQELITLPCIESCKIDYIRKKSQFYMMTSSNGNIFCVTCPLCGEFTGHWWIPLTKVSDVELWCFFHLRLNKRLKKHSWGWWFEMLSCSLWYTVNADICYRQSQDQTPFHIFWHLKCYIFLYIIDKRIFFSQLCPKDVALCKKNKQ